MLSFDYTDVSDTRCGGVLVEQSELLNAFTLPITHNANAKHGRADTSFTDRRMSVDPGWHGGLSSTREVSDMLVKGWVDGGERALALATEITDSLDSDVDEIRRKLVWSDTGDDVDIQRLYTGDWDKAFSSMRPAKRLGRQHVTIVQQWGGHTNISAEALFWGGAATIAMSDILEDAGYTVEAWTMSVARQDCGENAIVVLQTKEPDLPIVPDMLAATIGHAATFRTLGFRTRLCTNVEIDESMGGTIAVTRAVADEVAQALDTDYGSTVVVFDHCYSRSAAVQQLTDNIKQLETHKE